MRCSGGLKMTIAAIAAALSFYASGCTISFAEARSVYDRGREGNFIGFRARRGKEYYQFLRHGNDVYIEIAEASRDDVKWIPLRKKPYGGLVQKAFEEVEKEDRARINLDRLLE